MWSYTLTVPSHLERIDWRDWGRLPKQRKGFLLDLSPAIPAGTLAQWQARLGVQSIVFHQCDLVHRRRAHAVIALSTRTAATAARGRSREIAGGRDDSRHRRQTNKKDSDEIRNRRRHCYRRGLVRILSHRDSDCDHGASVHQRHQFCLAIAAGRLAASARVPCAVWSSSCAS